MNELACETSNEAECLFYPSGTMSWDEKLGEGVGDRAPTLNWSFVASLPPLTEDDKTKAATSAYGRAARESPSNCRNSRCEGLAGRAAAKCVAVEEDVILLLKLLVKSTIFAVVFDAFLVVAFSIFNESVVVVMVRRPISKCSVKL